MANAVNIKPIDKNNCDFSGWVTVANVKCKDGRVILPDAFKHCDGETVPLVWNHGHGTPSDVLGRVLLENRKNGVYGYADFNNNQSAQDAKGCLLHGDIGSLSIWANELIQKGRDVFHGTIQEVSLVLKGANPKAKIDVVAAHGENQSPSFYFVMADGSCKFHIAHSDEASEDDDVAYIDEDFVEDDSEEETEDADEETEDVTEEDSEDTEDSEEADDSEDSEKEYEEDPDDIQHSADGEKTMKVEEEKSYDIEDIILSMTDEQRSAVITLINAIKEQSKGNLKHSDDEPDTISTDKNKKRVIDVLKTLNDKQKAVVYVILQKLQESFKDNDEEDDKEEEIQHSFYEGEDDMKTNSFEADANPVVTRDIAGLIQAAIDDRDSFDKFSKAVIAHSAEFGYDEDNLEAGGELMHAYPTNDAGQTVTYGISNVEYMFPQARAISDTPILVNNNVEYVDDFKRAAHATPFAKVKTIAADITEDEARAKGYITGTQKLAEVFPLLTRETGPQTVYKLQKFDNDTLIDLAGNAAVMIPFIKNEMDIKLDEEVVNASLVGDGRAINDPYKIKEDKIRPIATDSDFYTIPVVVEFTSEMTDSQKAMAIEDAAVRARKTYRGAGNPTFYITNENLTNMILRRDTIGRRVYTTEAELAAAMRVKKLVECYALEGKTKNITVGTGNEATQVEVKLEGIIVNPIDYNYGTDQGGKKKFMDGFDIDFNQQKYLLETRLSGALVTPHSAIAIWSRVTD